MMSPVGWWCSDSEVRERRRDHHGRRAARKVNFNRFLERAVSAPPHDGQAVIASRRMSLTAGSRVAGFHLLERLGRGGQGEVWKAEDVASGMTRALKLVPMTGDARARDRVVREARVLATLRHPHVVQ